MKAKATGTGHFSGGFGVFQAEGGGVACKWELVKYQNFQYTIKLDGVGICSFRAPTDGAAKVHFNTLIDSKALAVQHPPKAPTPGAIKAQKNALKTSGGALRHIVRSSDPATTWQLLTEVFSEGAKNRFYRIKKRVERKTATESERVFYRLYRAVRSNTGSESLFKIWAAINWDLLEELNPGKSTRSGAIVELFKRETGVQLSEGVVKFSIHELRK
jgi:hypothetical protein